MSRLTKEQIQDIVEERKNLPSKEWYKSNLTAKSYCVTACREILKATESTGQLPDINSDEKCTYNRGKRVGMREKLQKRLGDMVKLEHYIRETNRHEERMCHCMFAQRRVGDFEVIDYQVPTTNGGHDKIDLILEKDVTVYITEAKYFNSTETLLRCVLEIQTYYQKLNGEFYNVYDIKKMNLKKAVLISKNTLAYEQCEKEWGQELLKAFDITLLILSRDNAKFHISVKK